MPTRRELFQTVRRALEGQDLEAQARDSALLEEPPDYNRYVRKLRRSGAATARAMALPDVASSAEERCYFEVFGTAVAHSWEVAEEFIRRAYASVEPQGSNVVEIYHQIHLMPGMDEASAGEAGAALSAAVGVGVASEVRTPRPSDADASFLDVSPLLREAKARAASLDRADILVHLWHACGQVSGAKFARMLSRLGFFDSPGDFEDMEHYQVGQSKFAERLQELKRLLWLGAADRVLGEDAVAGGAAALSLLAMGVVPVMTASESAVELVSAR